MDDLNSSLVTTVQNLIENTPAGRPASKLYYLIIGILIVSLGTSLFFLNTNYQKSQVLGSEVIKLSADIVTKDTLIASLNTSITNLNTEVQGLKEKVARLSQVAAESITTETTNVVESDPIKSRDTARISSMKEIGNRLNGYIMDFAVYPVAPKSGCIPADDLKKSSIAELPVDPIEKRYSSGCIESDTMTYAYRTMNNSDGIAFFAIAAELESETGGNSAVSIDEIMEFKDPLTYILNLKQGSGKYYIIAN